MMLYSRFYVDKITHTFADALTAFGMARILDEILGRANGSGEVLIIDEGPYYRLETDSPIDDLWLNNMGSTPFILAPVIRTFKNRNDIPADLPPQGVIDYEAVRDRVNTYWDTIKALPRTTKAAQGSSQQQALAAAKPAFPDPHWDVYRALNPHSLPGYNALVLKWWKLQQILPDLLRLLFALTAQHPMDIEGATIAWKKLVKRHNLDKKVAGGEATALQLFNPAQGKGQNQPKASRLTMANVSAFWPLEWLKAIGFYQAALTKTLKGSKDRKTYVVAPKRVSLRTHQGIMSAFRDKMLFSEPATRADILVTLRYTESFLEYCAQAQGTDLLEQLYEGSSPRDIVSGFYAAFYKSLGNSAATMNLAFINVPGWVRPSNLNDVAAYRALLEEHRNVVRSLDERNSDAFNLLQDYRDFITGDNLQPFFAFATAYSGYLVAQKERRQYAPQFTVNNLRRLFEMAEPKLSEILDPKLRPGFQNIANAIRQSTVVAQYRKQQGDRRYDVRYGLGQELARKANYPEEFITALSDFLYKYNAENAQVMENRQGPYRRSIQTSDIDDIVSLVDQYGSALICNLLVAYGYARRGAAAPEEALETMDDAEDTAEGIDAS